MRKYFRIGCGLVLCSLSVIALASDDYVPKTQYCKDLQLKEQEANKHANESRDATIKSLALGIQFLNECVAQGK